ncbi:MAG: ATP-dependent zinc metalloprotease FtsH [Peptococcaceae bacterium]|nr:ATP-dependent zinc metalloprotease FtsH [Peptococcaceae bacterium]
MNLKERKGPIKEQKGPRKPLIYYYLIAMLILMLLNWLVIPLISSSAIQQVDYGTFLKQLRNKEISQVEVNNEAIYYLLDPAADKTIYSVVPMNDPDLVNRLEESGAVYSQIKPKENSFLSTLLMNVIFIAILVFVGQMLSRSMMKKMGGNNFMSFGKSNAKIYVSAQTGKTFADVAGQDEAKEALQELVSFLHNPSKYEVIGASMPKGALLVGPPGTGKTLLAKAVAGEANVPFFSISGSEFVEMFVGMGAAKVRDLFKQAQEKAPCIVFIDEIDTIGKRRDNALGAGNDEREQTLNQLLTEMDGFDSKKGVVILAATNRPDSLDKALLRPGRFDRRIPVELPDLKGREDILRVHSKSVKIDSSIDFNSIARATVGASGADLANIINEAALRAVREGRQKVIQADLDASVETVLAGYERKNAVIPLKEKRIVAYHEIGHALVAALQSDSAPVHKITIIPRTSGALGYTMQLAEDESLLMSREEAFNKIATLTGGRAAEELIFGTCTSGAANDIEQATKLARAMVTRLGMTKTFGMVALETLSNQYLGGDPSLSCSESTAAQVDQEVIAIIKKAHEKALDILKENAAKLNELAQYLLEKETITGGEFLEILNRNRQKALPQGPAAEAGGAAL